MFVILPVADDETKVYTPVSSVVRCENTLGPDLHSLAEKNRPAAKFPHLLYSQHTELPFFQRIQWVVGGSLSAVVLCKIVSFLFKLEDAPEKRGFFYRDHQKPYPS